jgi:hypothetical protein
MGPPIAAGIKLVQASWSCLDVCAWVLVANAATNATPVANRNSSRARINPPSSAIY